MVRYSLIPGDDRLPVFASFDLGGEFLIREREASDHASGFDSVVQNHGAALSHGRGGFSLDFWVKFESLAGGQLLVDARDSSGDGFSVYTTDRRTIQISLRGPCGSKALEDFGIAEASWDCDAGHLRLGAGITSGSWWMGAQDHFFYRGWYFQ